MYQSIVLLNKATVLIGIQIARPLDFVDGMPRKRQLEKPISFDVRNSRNWSGRNCMLLKTWYVCSWRH